MEHILKIDVTHSSRRPEGQAWRASSCGHITYAPTREEALERHSDVIGIYRMIDEVVSQCAVHAGTAAAAE